MPQFCLNSYTNTIETGFYYLRSRYYDPIVKRFINSDSYASTGQGFLGNNMFAYCQNNPVINSDQNGHFILTCIIVGAVVGAAVGGYIGATESKKQTGEVDPLAVGVGILGGGILGGLIGWGIGAIATSFGVGSAAAGTGSAGTAGTALYENWQAAEQGLRDTMNSVSSVAERTFATPLGTRIVDAYNTADQIIGEAKYGAQSLTEFISKEVAKDAWLLQNHLVNGVEWHFYESAASGTLGATGPLFRELYNAGIKTIVHLLE